MLYLIAEEVQYSRTLACFIVHSIRSRSRPEKEAPEVEEASLFFAVVFLENRFDCFGGCFSVVEWQIRENMMSDVSIDDVMCLVIAKPAQRPINGAECTSEPCPLSRIIMRQTIVSVLKESDGNQEGVGDQERWKIK